MIDKEKLKDLREQRKDNIKKIQKMVKEQNKVKENIKKSLQDGPKTVPEISKLTGYDTQEVMWYIASLKRYGEVVEGDKEGDYFTYVLSQQDVSNKDKQGDS